MKTVEDNFERADNLDLGADWDSGYTSQVALQIVGNRIRPSGAGVEDSMETHNKTFGRNMFAQITLLTLGGTFPFPRVLLRCAAPAAKTGYEFMGGTASPFTRLGRWVSGSLTTLATSTQVWAAGDVLRGAIVDTSLYIFRNGILVLKVKDESASSLYAGRAGIILYGTADADVEVHAFIASDIDATRIDYPVPYL